MLEKVKAPVRSTKKDKGKESISIYDVLQVLIEHGHNKNEILQYSREELALFYEQCIKQDMRRNADIVEYTAMAIGTAFGGSKKIMKLLDEMRN